jgi:hypothetical protein
VSPSEFHKLLRLLDDRSTFRRPDDGDAPAAAELQKSLVAKESQRAKDGVCVDTENCGEVSRRRETITRFRLAVGDGSTDLRRDLLVEIRGSALFTLTRSMVLVILARQLRRYA